MLNKFFFNLLLVFFLAEILSLLNFSIPVIQSIVLIALTIIVLILVIKKTEYAPYLLLGELIAGGQGYLFFWQIGDFRLSFRLILFGVIFVVWAIKTLYNRNFEPLKGSNLLLFLPFLAFLGIGAIKGVLGDQSFGQVFSDINGYLYFGLIGLFLTTTINWQKIINIILAGTTILSLKTLVVLFIFAHQWSQVGPTLLYGWIRTTLVGEITIIVEPLYRVFMFSHFYSLVAFFIILGVIFLNRAVASPAPTSRTIPLSFKKYTLWLLLWLNFLILVVSQSRSLWLAGLVVFGLFGIYYVYLFLRKKVGWKKVLTLILLLPVFWWTSNLAINIIIGNFDISLASQRLKGIESQVGVSSRRAQISPMVEQIKTAPILGHGFGKAITYQTDDPRYKNKDNPEGWITTSALELGYLDLILKIGVLGLLAYFIFGLNILKNIISAAQKNPQLCGLVLGLLVLVIIHAFTPYLNHPLGIGYLLVLLGLTRN